MKSALTAANTAYDSVSKATKQAVEMAEANMDAATSATIKSRQHSIFKRPQSRLNQALACKGVSSFLLERILKACPLLWQAFFYPKYTRKNQSITSNLHCMLSSILSNSINAWATSSFLPIPPLCFHTQFNVSCQFVVAYTGKAVQLAIQESRFQQFHDRGDSGLRSVKQQQGFFVFQLLVVDIADKSCPAPIRSWATPLRESPAQNDGDPQKSRQCGYTGLGIRLASAGKSAILSRNSSNGWPLSSQRWRINSTAPAWRTMGRPKAWAAAWRVWSSGVPPMPPQLNTM